MSERETQPGYGYAAFERTLKEAGLPAVTEFVLNVTQALERGVRALDEELDGPSRTVRREDAERPATSYRWLVRSSISAYAEQLAHEGAPEQEVEQAMRAVRSGRAEDIAPFLRDHAQDWGGFLLQQTERAESGDQR